ncbi:MAG TPA: protein kinase [Kofleriaceae bacterium]|nr:protein kinase [Kofleriaceae bacterium]
MGGRSYAGFEYQRRLSAGFYGEVFRAQNAAGQGACILHVGPWLAAREGYVEALARFGGDLSGVQQRNLVITRSVGRALDGTVVVVTDAVVGAVSTEELLDSQRGQRPPSPIIIAIVSGVMEALAFAHQRGVVHGGVHPRSVVIDAAGGVRLDHCAVARALAAVAASSDDPELYDGFRGYLAPELALGEEPTPASDVYALGAVMYWLFGGEVSGGVQPGRLKATTSVRRVVMRAMDTDVSRRFAHGGEARDAWVRAIEADSCEVATDRELAEHTADARAAGGSRATSVAEESELDAATEDLLSALSHDGPDVDGALASLAAEVGEDDSLVGAEPSDDGDEEPTAIAPTRRPASSRGVADVLDSLAEELGTGVEADSHDGAGLAEVEAHMTRPGAFGVEPDTDVAAELLEDDHSQLTHVDDVMPHDDGRDPISELIELAANDRPTSEVELAPSDDDHTPLPPPQVHESGSFTRESRQILRGKSQRSVQERAEDALVGLDDEPEEAAKPARGARLAKPIVLEETEFVSGRRSGVPGWVYLALSTVALGGMFFLVVTRADTCNPDRVEQRRKDREAEDRAKENRLRAELERGAEIFVTANEPGAAVWLRLGRTPVDSMPLPTWHPHQLRLELDGFAHDDVIVSASHWSGDRASVTRTLVPPGPDHVTPAWPPRMPDSATRDFPSTQKLGIITVQSTPAQAEAWLLVGYTNNVHLRDFAAGVKYELKVLKDGFRPGFAIIETDDWKALRARDPTAMHFEITRHVELAPAQPVPSPR